MIMPRQLEYAARRFKGSKICTQCRVHCLYVKVSAHFPVKSDCRCTILLWIVQSCARASTRMLTSEAELSSISSCVTAGPEPEISSVTPGAVRMLLPVGLNLIDGWNLAANCYALPAASAMRGPHAGSGRLQCLRTLSSALLPRGLKSWRLWNVTDSFYITTLLRQASPRRQSNGCSPKGICNIRLLSSSCQTQQRKMVGAHEYKRTRRPDDLHGSQQS